MMTANGLSYRFGFLHLIPAKFSGALPIDMWGCYIVENITE